MKSTSKHHPTEPAHWDCPNCNTYYCSSCILKREKQIYGSTSKEYLHLCPSCMKKANWIGAANALEPFWTP